MYDMYVKCEMCGTGSVMVPCSGLVRETHLRKTKVLGNEGKNRLNSMRIRLNRTDPHQMNII